MVVDTKFGHIFPFTHLSVLFVGLDCLVPPTPRAGAAASQTAAAHQAADAEDDGRHDQSVRHRSRLAARD